MSEIKKLPKIAIAGVGNWGRNLARTFAQLGALSTVYDTDVSQAQAIADLYHCTVSSWENILRDNNLDAVVISAPASQHGLLAEQVLMAGKHVFVEKPLALEVKVAEQLCELARQQNRCLMVGHLLQYHPAFIRLKLLADDGALGRVNYVYSQRLNFGKFRREEDVLWSFAPHDISMILSLMGTQPNFVEAIGAYYLHQSIADVTTTHMSFPGGQQAHVFVSWLHPFKEQKLVVVGDKAMAVFDDGEPWERKLMLYRHSIQWRENKPLPKSTEGEPILLDPIEPLLNECRHFLECVQTGKKPLTDGYEGLHVLKVLEEASQSLQKKISPSQNKFSKKYPGVSLHESAYIDDEVEIGAGTKIWHFSHLLPKSSIGENCVIGQNVVIGPGVRIGNRCKVQNNVSVYQGVILEDDVFCGPSCVFTNVKTPRAHISRKNEFHVTHVKKGVTIGANATIICGVTLGEYAFIGAGAVVTKDVPPHALMVGNPAKQIGWVSHAGEPLKADFICPREKRRYRIDQDHQLEEIVV